MTWAEVFTALQQGTIDGQENPLAIIYAQKLYEVQKYLTLTGHVYDACAVMMSMSTYNSLTPDQRRIVEETVREVTSWQRAYCEKMEKDLVDKLKEKGMVVSELADPEAFQAQVDVVYKEFEDKYPWASELIKAVNAQAQ
jgi:TRAP-type C4-dicarboxylate transport system substrate-binding protein